MKSDYLCDHITFFCCLILPTPSNERQVAALWLGWWNVLHLFFPTRRRGLPFFVVVRACVGRSLRWNHKNGGGDALSLVPKLSVRRRRLKTERERFACAGTQVNKHEPSRVLCKQSVVVVGWHDTKLVIERNCCVKEFEVWACTWASCPIRWSGLCVPLGNGEMQISGGNLQIKFCVRDTPRVNLRVRHKKKWKIRWRQ